MRETSIENIQTQMRKGTLEFAILLVISQSSSYASDIIKELKAVNLLVMDGTLYPLLARLKNDNLLEYSWQESCEGPPRKYYTLTKKGRDTLELLAVNWKQLNQSINSLMKKYE